MAGAALKKRARDEKSKSRGARPPKKQKRQQAYHSSSEEEDDDEGVSIPVNLLDSEDEDFENAVVDDGADSESDDGSDSASDIGQPAARKPAAKGQKMEVVRDAPDTDNSEDDDDDEDEESEDDQANARKKSTKSKRNDETAFATSISKILSSKLSSSRRADPIVSRSAEAHTAAREAVDAALDSKARKRLRDAKALAKEKGRVKDVLVASTTRTLNIQTGEIEEVVDGGETTTQILETEKRLRKVAQRGVVKLFNAVRAAQSKATEAERSSRKEGAVGMGQRNEKVTEMSRKGFLDLIASGGGRLNKKPLEEG